MMSDRDDEEEQLHSVALQNVQSIRAARQQAEDELVRTKEELEKQSELLRVTLASIGDAVVTTDPEARVLSLNAVAEGLTGWTQQEAQGRLLVEIFRIINEDTRQPVENPAEQALREGRIVGLANHTILIARDGTETPIDDSAAPIRDDQGRVHGVVLVFRSIAERKRAERALRQSEGELADFFENASVGLHWVGPDGTILRVNQAELKLLGYTREEYVGHHIAEFHDDQVVIADILQRLSAGETLRDYEARMRCKDGSIKHVLVDSSVLWDHGQFIHTRCFTRDITDRKRAEEIQARLAAIVESSQDAIISKTLDSRILSWNAGAERLFGHMAGEAIGQPITILMPADRQDEERVILERLRRGERVEPYDTVRVSKEGRRIDISLTVSPVLDSANRVIAASAIARDITARKRAEHRLAIQHGVTQALAESAALNDAAPTILRTICEYLGWDFGALWYVDQSCGLLNCSEVWHRSTIQLPQFEAICRQRTFQPGIGLPGRVWQSARAAWIPDVVKDDNFPRASIAAAEGLHAAFGFPIVLNKEVLGVIEFFSPEIRQPDEELLQMMTAIGSQIGQYIERKRAEQAVRASEARKTAILETSLDSIITCDHSGFILEFNPAAEQTFGFRKAEVLGRDMADLIVPLRQRPQYRQGMAHFLATGEGPILNRRIEMMAMRADGREFPVELAVTRIPGEGLPLFTANVRDITERRRAEQTTRFLADASAALSALTDYESTLQKVAALAVPFFADWCAVDMQEPDGSICRLAVTHIDPAKVALAHELFHSYPPQPSDSRGVMHVLRTGESEWMPEIPDSLLVESAQNEEQLRVYQRWGLRSYICVPLRSRTRTLGALTFVTAESGRVYDITDLTAAEDLAQRAVIAIENAMLLATLKETDRRKDEFLAMLAHELRNPLAPVRNAVEIIRASVPLDSDLQFASDVIDRQIQQMTRLVDDLLDVSRISSGKITLRKERINLASVVNSAIEASRPLIEESRHRITVSIPPQPIFLDADLTRLTQVLLNLLNNAAKYMDSGGQIWLTVEREQQLVLIRVKDTGIGITPEMLPRIFDLFTQVDLSLDRSQGGLGIGLTLVDRLVSMHGGTITAHSEGSGKGSEFVVRLPIAAASSDVKQSPTTGHVEKDSGLRKQRLLVVDDNKDAADTLSMLLRLLGHQVHSAHDGQSAVDRAQELQPEVVFLDIGLPKLNGYDAARLIRKNNGPNVLLIAMTGWGQEEDRRLSKEAGFDYHLTKPVELNALRDLLTDPNLKVRSQPE
jgi:PAS domain S-box-containing protein